MSKTALPLTRAMSSPGYFSPAQSPNPGAYSPSLSTPAPRGRPRGGDLRTSGDPGRGQGDVCSVGTVHHAAQVASDSSALSARGCLMVTQEGIRQELCVGCEGLHQHVLEIHPPGSWVCCVTGVATGVCMSVMRLHISRSTLSSL